jgi:hypothetical protein
MNMLEKTAVPIIPTIQSIDLKESSPVSSIDRTSLLKFANSIIVKAAKAMVTKRAMFMLFSFFEEV